MVKLWSNEMEHIRLWHILIIYITFDCSTVVEIQRFGWRQNISLTYSIQWLFRAWHCGPGHQQLVYWPSYPTMLLFQHQKDKNCNVSDSYQFRYSLGIDCYLWGTLVKKVCWKLALINWFDKYDSLCHYMDYYWDPSFRMVVQWCHIGMSTS